MTRQDGGDPSGKRRWLDRERIRGAHGTLLVHEVGLVQGEENLNESRRTAEEAPGDVEDVTARRGGAREIQHEVGVVQELGHECALQCGRVVANALLELVENPGWIEERTTVVNLREVDVVVESVWMTEVVLAGNDSSRTVLDHIRDSFEVAIDPVDLETLDPQPRSTVHPRTPLPEPGHLGSGTRGVELTGELAENVHCWRSRGLVVDPEIDVGIGFRRTSGPRASKRDGSNARDFPEASGDVLGYRQRFDGCAS